MRDVKKIKGGKTEEEKRIIQYYSEINEHNYSYMSGVVSGRELKIQFLSLHNHVEFVV